MEKLRASDLFSPQEIRDLRQLSTFHGLWAVVWDWLVILGSLALCGYWLHPISIALALLLIGGRQLGLAILMHEASHRTLLPNRRLNDAVGRWLCAAPIWLDLRRYRTHHLAHHAKTGTAADPDLCLVAAFPTSQRGLLRKFARDLSGLTGIKRAVATLAMDFEFITYTASAGARRLSEARPGRLRRGLYRVLPMLITNAALWFGLSLAGHAALYFIWLLAWLTTFSLWMRIRSIAEHACTERSSNPLRNTRTTYANAISRATVAPHRVNFHLEHHLLMTVPFFRLPEVHRRLVARDALPADAVAGGYSAVLRLAATPR